MPYPVQAMSMGQRIEVICGAISANAQVPFDDDRHRRARRERLSGELLLWRESSTISYFRNSAEQEMRSVVVNSRRQVTMRRVAGRIQVGHHH